MEKRIGVPLEYAADSRASQAKLGDRQIRRAEGPHSHGLSILQDMVSREAYFPILHLRFRLVYRAFVVEDGRVIVVGSGPAGAAAAVFLCRAGAKVRLLEAGPERSALGLTMRIHGFTLFRRQRSLRQREGVTATADARAELFEDLAPGGLTNHWSCAVPRFAPEDFADADRAGEAFKWPIGYRDIAPWYDEVEPLLHIAGMSSGTDQLPAGRVRSARQLGPDWAGVVEGARRAGRTLVPMPYAYGSDTSVTASGTVFNSFVRLVKPEIRAGRLSASYNARVLRLEWSPRAKRVEGVVFLDTRTGAEIRVACRAVVLAAGAVGTAEILLASSSPDFPAGLGNTHGVLGRYLHDHPLGKLVVDLDAPISVHPPSYLTRPAIDRAPPLYAAACMQWSGTEILARSALARTPGRLRWIGFSVFGTMAPSSEDWIALDPGRRLDDGRCGLKLNIRHPPEARVALDLARDDLMSALTRAGLKPRVRTWHIEPPGDSKHYGGTCRMHALPRFGMIDGWSRLHAARNVAVADSAAFTTGPEKNPVLTAMALAARAGDRLAEGLKAGDL
jgi:choline dehydrogenase-like flavoprotein